MRLRRAVAALLHRETATVALADPARSAEATDPVAADSHRLPIQDGAPVALSDRDAHPSATVQDGGGYGPPGRRDCGRARRGGALHPNQLRRDGVTRTAPVTATPTALRLHRAIGLREAGDGSPILVRARPEAAA